MLKTKTPSKIFLFLTLLLFTSCGYRFEGPRRSEEVVTLSIPYVAGDADGQLTDELIRQFASSGAYKYRAYGGSLELLVTLVDLHAEQIGWRYKRKEDGSLVHDLITTEGRRFLGANVTLIDTVTGEIFYGPTRIQASVDYDYYESNVFQDLSFVNFYGVRQTSVNFSLGQLDSSEGASDAAYAPLSRQLAKKIVDRILRARY